MIRFALFFVGLAILSALALGRFVRLAVLSYTGDNRIYPFFVVAIILLLIGFYLAGKDRAK